jgi:hypothetical protein
VWGSGVGVDWLIRRNKVDWVGVRTTAAGGCLARPAQASQRTFAGVARGSFFTPSLFK